MTKIIKEVDNILLIIERAENMCLVSDGPVSPTITEMTDDGITKIYKSAKKIKKILEKNNVKTTETKTTN